MQQEARTSSDGIAVLELRREESERRAAAVVPWLDEVTTRIARACAWRFLTGIAGEPRCGVTLDQILSGCPVFFPLTASRLMLLCKATPSILKLVCVFEFLDAETVLPITAFEPDLE